MKTHRLCSQQFSLGLDLVLHRLDVAIWHFSVCTAMSERLPWSLPPGFGAQSCLPWAMACPQPMHGMPAMPPFGGEPCDVSSDDHDTARPDKGGKKHKKGKKDKKDKKGTKKRHTKQTQHKARKAKESSTSSSSSSSDQESSQSDQKRISRAFTTLGFNNRNSYPRSRKWSIVRELVCPEFDLVRNASMSSLQLDQIIYLGTGAGPNTLLSDLRQTGCKKFGELKALMVKTAQRKGHQEALAKLKEDLSNLAALAEEKGWCPSWTRKYHLGRHRVDKPTPGAFLVLPSYPEVHSGAQGSNTGMSPMLVQLGSTGLPAALGPDEAMKSALAQQQAAAAQSAQEALALADQASSAMVPHEQAALVAKANEVAELKAALTAKDQELASLSKASDDIQALAQRLHSQHEQLLTAMAAKDKLLEAERKNLLAAQAAKEKLLTAQASPEAHAQSEALLDQTAPAAAPEGLDKGAQCVKASQLQEAQRLALQWSQNQGLQASQA